MTIFYGGIDSSKLPTGSGNGLNWTYGYSTTNMGIRSSYAIATDGTDIYLFGGYNSTALTTCAKYTVATDTWSALTSLGTAKYGMGFCKYGDYVYLAGGYTTGVVNHFYSYSISGNSWNTSLTAMPAAKNLPTASSWNGFVYVFGGSTTNLDTGATNAVYKYDIAGNSWSTMSTAPYPTTIIGARSVTVGNYIYTIGGATSATTYQNKLYRYTPSEAGDGSWDTMTDVPTTIRNCGFANVGDYLYVIGGETGTASTTNSSRCYRYKISTNTWEEILSIPTISDFGVVTIIPPTRRYSEASVIGTNIWLPSGIQGVSATKANSILRLQNC